MSMLEDWTSAALAELGIDVKVPTDDLLVLADADAGVGQQLAPPHQQAEWSEHEGFAHRSYSDDGAAGSTNRSVSRLRPSAWPESSSTCTS